MWTSIIAEWVETVDPNKALPACRFLAALDLSLDDLILQVINTQQDPQIAQLLIPVIESITDKARLKRALQKLSPVEAINLLLTKGKSGHALILNPALYTAVEPYLQSIAPHLPPYEQERLLASRDENGRTLLHRNEGRSLLFLDSLQLEGAHRVDRILLTPDNFGNLPLHFPEVLKAAIPILRDMGQAQCASVFSTFNQSGASVYDVAVNAPPSCTKSSSGLIIRPRLRMADPQDPAKITVAKKSTMP